jgi:hypothetical protein
MFCFGFWPLQFGARSSPEPFTFLSLKQDHLALATLVEGFQRAF